jgi:TRAP-type C4-dicarboxylate transport system permease small subunit
LSKNFKEAATFVFVVGAILLIASLCVIGILFSTAAASKGDRTFSLYYMLPFGGGASALAAITALVTGWRRRLAKSVPADEASNDQGR